PPRARGAGSRASPGRSPRRPACRGLGCRRARPGACRRACRTSVGKCTCGLEEALKGEPDERSHMSVAKVVQIIGSSPESFAKAADAAVQEASKTIRGITGADVVSMSALVENDRISEYRTTVNIAFADERSGE